MKVSELKNIAFNSLSLNEQLQIKHTGRPTPELNIIQEEPQYKNRKGFVRRVDKNIYKKTLWICGCEERKSFYCFVCLLFGGDDNWTKKGLSTLKHLPSAIRRHENSTKHIDNFVSFQLLGKNNIVKPVKKVDADDTRRHNATVRKNREVLSKIIDILRLCGTCKLAPGGVFSELVDFLANVDRTFNNQMQESTVFNFKDSIRDEILRCMFEVCREYILEEIREAAFLALAASDATDESGRNQIVIVLRYEVGGKVFERFWGFTNPRPECILEELSPILENSPEKLICQTYDGSIALRGQVGDVNVKIREQYKNAHFVYCYSHQLDKIVEQAASRISGVRLFFANLNGLSKFLSQSPDVSDKETWNCHSNFLKYVYDNRNYLIEYFESVISGPQKYTSEAVMHATGFITLLQDGSFLFWLEFFHFKIMPHVDFLFGQVQTVKIQKCVDHFEAEIEALINDLTHEAVILEPARKRFKLNQGNVNESAREVCDIVSSEVRNRFSFTNHLSGAALFLKGKYNEYRKTLPLDDIDQFCEAYPMINKEILKLQLSVFYSRKEMTGSSNDIPNSELQTLNFIQNFGLDVAFSEIVKVLKILVTIPMMTGESGRTFPTLENIKACLGSIVGEGRLTELAMLSIEKAMVADIPNFNERVIERFSSDERRMMDFHFKK